MTNVFYASNRNIDPREEEFFVYAIANLLDIKVDEIYLMKSDPKNFTAAVNTNDNDVVIFGPDMVYTDASAYHFVCREAGVDTLIYYPSVLKPNYKTFLPEDNDWLVAGMKEVTDEMPE